MVVKRGLAAQGCYQCRSAALKLFASPSSPAPFARTAGSLPVSRLRTVPPTFTRGFTSSIQRPNSSSDQQQSEQNEQDLEDEDSSIGDEEGEPTAPEVANAADVPWYLQVEPPRHVATIEPPPLPEVPEGAPEVVGPLLKFVSEELGLDELNLMDLRELDPPAALGPNLFMLFGTARSERHLHVSAGRLLRWLRYNHRIWANADGLLGPNERKTKLKRKAKRAKLLGTMGTDDGDDGIRTGWICVNLGTIGHGGEASTIIGEDGRVAGFGVTRNGSSIVVQIMTESRRAELDLESLWENALNPPAPKDISTTSKGSRATQTGSNESEAGPIRTPIEQVSHRLAYNASRKVRVSELLRAHPNAFGP
ncbi:ATPase synthesis protein 25 mitochondrial [Diatrype stigma]|uniref:ATPase synthesis protein 25 n=1 Tax=Diatrype stigma TaxID=117547 RepID=A0AAN9YP11_9PEZI